jgi:ERCC4-related helicase
MFALTKDHIKNQIADHSEIYERGESIFKMGNYHLREADFDTQSFRYDVDGQYGDYEVHVEFKDGKLEYECNCPYYSDGCKHTVAVFLDILEQLARYKTKGEKSQEVDPVLEENLLSYEEIKNQAIEERKEKAKSEKYKIRLGESFKGEHWMTTIRGAVYVITLHQPILGKGHCNCQDFNSNKLGTCKHILHLHAYVQSKKDFASRVSKECFPFVHLYWDAPSGKPRVYFENQRMDPLYEECECFFDDQGFFHKEDIALLIPFLEKAAGNKNLRVEEYLLKKVNEVLFQKKMAELQSTCPPIDFSRIKAKLYPYQKEGVQFALFKKAAIIADEMGLGKTLQAITVAILKKAIFQCAKVLVVCPASLKEQWKREIERFTDEKVTVLSGSKIERQETYKTNTDFFKITNYEAVLRDILAIQRFQPDLIILDEAQRIKNFETKTAEAIKSIPHAQSLVITGTPLENKLEDLYSIVQFADPGLFTPLWEFAAHHFTLKKEKKNSVLGYHNLDIIRQKIKPLIIRRKREDVLDDLPEQVTNNYYIDLTNQQLKIHQGYLQALLVILNKKFLTPIDMRRIQELLLSMRMVCDSTFLIDRKTNLSPKLDELRNILTDLILENQRKTVIFTEWTTMTFLIGKVLSEMEIPFIEFTGKVPVAKRQRLITAFNEDPSCKVFLATEAGGLGLNLQTADCVINFELPWNPARLNQRTGRVMRIGQKSKCINVVNLIAKNSIEEKILATLHLKQELFNGVFDGTIDHVEFSQEKKAEFINKIRSMLDEELIIPVKERPDPEELPEETPHYRNPQILREEKLDILGEETVEEADFLEERNAGDVTSITERVPEKECLPVSTEKMEEVLENGIKFLNGLMVISTGASLIPEEQGKTIQIDRKTGEVTMKFKLPGFSNRT